MLNTRGPNTSEPNTSGPNTRGPSTPRPTRWIAALVAVPLALALTACGNKTEHVGINAQSVGGKAGFGPSVIDVKRGDKVDITLGNTTDKTHGFTIEGYGVKPVTVGSHQTIHVKFTAKKSGTYRIFCQLHPAHQPAMLQVD